MKEQKRAGLAEIHRVLKPGGRFLMVVWVPGWATFSLANLFCLFLTSKAGWRTLARAVARHGPRYEEEQLRLQPIHRGYAFPGRARRAATSAAEGRGSRTEGAGAG